MAQNRLYSAVLCAIALAVVAAVGPSSAQDSGGDQDGVPDAVLGQLPDDAQVLSALVTPLAGTDRGPFGIVLYTQPNMSQAGHVAIFSGAYETWQPFADYTTGADPIMQIFAVGDRPALAFRGTTEPNVTELTVVRFSGDSGSRTLVQVLHLNSTRGVEFKDLDYDGTPEAVAYTPTSCQTYPDLLTVYRWNGAVFADATGQFPAFLDEADAQIRRLVSAHQSGSDPEGDCLFRLRDRISQQSGRWVPVMNTILDRVGEKVFPAPAYPEDNRILKVSDNYILSVSNTQGRTWQQIGESRICESGPVGRLVLSPTFQSDNTLIFLPIVSACHRPSLGPNGYPAFISHDGGVTWSAISSRAASDTAQVVFSPNYANDHRVWLANGRIVEGSSDGGTTWQYLARPLPEARVTSFAVTSDADPLYLLGASDPTREPSWRYFRSMITSAGRGWQEVTDVFRDPETLHLPQLSFRTSRERLRVLGLTPHSGTWISTDAGETWQHALYSTAEVTPAGCLVVNTQKDIGWWCSDADTGVGFQAPGTIQRVLSVTNFDTTGGVLIEADNGWWSYNLGRASSTTR